MSSRRTAAVVTAGLSVLTGVSVVTWTWLGGSVATTSLLPGRHSGLSWVVMAVLASVGDWATIVVHGRRQSRSVTIGEAPLVFGLIFFDPVPLIVGRVVGMGVAHALRRRAEPVKLLVNLAMTVAETIVARAVYVAAAQRWDFPHLGPALAAVAGAVAGIALTSLVLGAMLAVMDHQSVWTMARSAMTEGMINSVAAAFFGLACAYAVHDEPSSALALVLCAVTAVVVYRAHSRLYREHRRLGFVYRFNRQIASCENSRDLTERTLELARELLHAEHAEMILPGADETQPLTHVVSPLEGAVQWRSRLPEDLEPVLVAAAHGTQAHTLVVRRTLLRRLAEDPVLRTVLGPQRLGRLLQARSTLGPAFTLGGEIYLRSLGLNDGVTVPLEVEDRHLGCLIVAGRMDHEVGFTSGDVDLLGSVASQAAIALHRGELVDRVRWEASHDSLTGLPNRLMFNRSLQDLLNSWTPPAPPRPEGALVPAPRRPGAGQTVPAATTEAVGPAHEVAGVAMLDLDRFHDVNDTFGHDVADDLLRRVAARLAEAAGDDALVARLGSDEFGVLITHRRSEEHVLDVVQRLLNSLAEPIPIGDTAMTFTASAGLAVLKDEDASVTSLVVQADVALQAAKQMSGPIVEYSPDIDNRAPHRLAIAADLRSALRDGDLAIHVQPQADLDTGCLRGVEALVRWHHPTKGLVFPDEFIPVAETTGLVGELTQVVLDKSLAAVAGWRRRGLTVPIAVNLSARSLVDPELVSSVQRALRRYRIPAELLTLEITESSVMADPQRAIRTLTHLRTLGITLAVDDFGTGYSSLSYLQRLPVQEVKIDKSFVMTLRDNPSNASIVRSIVDLGANLGLRVVAEGVEDAHSWALLDEMGCDVAQGYYLARPMPADDLLGWLDASPVVRRPAVAPA